MLRAGLTPDTTVSCPPTLTVEGREFQNVPGYPTAALGDVPLRTAFANSCNTAMIGQREAVSQQALHDAAASLGLGVESELGAPAFFGDVPTDSQGTEHAASMIGQGKVQASPLAMATVAASVAAGRTVAPVLVHPDVQTVAEEQPASTLTEQEAATLRELMRGVVTDGSASILQDLPGEPGAKTGTAQYGDGSQSHAWMIATQGTSRSRCSSRRERVAPSPQARSCTPSSTRRTPDSPVPAVRWPSPRNRPGRRTVVHERV